MASCISHQFRRHDKLLIAFIQKQNFKNQPSLFKYMLFAILNSSYFYAITSVTATKRCSFLRAGSLIDTYHEFSSSCDLERTKQNKKIEESTESGMSFISCQEKDAIYDRTWDQSTSYIGTHSALGSLDDEYIISTVYGWW